MLHYTLRQALHLTVALLRCIIALCCVLRYNVTLLRYIIAQRYALRSCVTAVRYSCVLRDDVTCVRIYKFCLFFVHYICFSIINQVSYAILLRYFLALCVTLLRCFITLLAWASKLSWNFNYILKIKIEVIKKIKKRAINKTNYVTAAQKWN